VVLAAAVAVLAVAAVVAAIVVAGGDAPSTTSTTTVVASIPPDTFFAPLPAPSGVSVVADGTGSFTVAIPPVAGAQGYEVEPTNGTAVVAVAPGEDTAVVEGQGATTMCVVVRALGNEGRVSRDAGPFCSG
jgi:hypothetical protein